jgi:hypothetical protein
MTFIPNLGRPGVKLAASIWRKKDPLLAKSMHVTITPAGYCCAEIDRTNKQQKNQICILMGLTLE